MCAYIYVYTSRLFRVSLNFSLRFLLVIRHGLPELRQAYLWTRDVRKVGKRKVEGKMKKANEIAKNTIEIISCVYT